MGCDLENHGNGFDLPEPEVDVAALKKRMLDRITKVHSDEAEIERLRAELATARKQERERCAKVCLDSRILQPLDDFERGFYRAGCVCAAAIRALEDEK